MTTASLGLFIHFVFFAIGVYLYLFARGVIKFKDTDAGNRAREFQQDNKTWMRLLGLGLAAIMAMNMLADISELWQEQ